MPSIPPRVGPRPLDLQLLAQTDPLAAQVGHALNDVRQGGVDLDGAPLTLRWDEFALVAPRFARLFPDVTPMLHRLQAQFLNAAPAHPPPNDAGPGLVDHQQWAAPQGSHGVENGKVIHVNGRDVVLLDRADPNFTQAQLFFGPVSGPTAPLLSASPKALQLSPTFAAGHVYFLAADVAGGAATMHRVPFDGVTAGAPQPVRGLAGLGAFSWPQVQQHPSGALLAAYRDELSRPRLAFSDDGVDFHTLPGSIEPRGAAMVALGIFPSGTLAMTYQRETQSGYVSTVRLSRDGQTWSAPLPVTVSSSNVHDTSLVVRKDGGLDLYYVFTTATEGFGLYRRSLDDKGTLGPEQRVTMPGPHVNKPQVTRAPNGDLHVAFVEVTSRDAGGAVATQGLRSVVLKDDAPLA